MLELKLKDKTYSIPNDWSEVKVKDYQIIVETNEREDLSELEKLVVITAEISSLTKDEVFSMTSSSFKNIMKELNFLSTEIKSIKKEFVKAGGDEYYFYQPQDLNVAETINIDLIMTRHNSKLHLAIPDLLCIFLRKKVDGELEEYRSSFKERREMFMDCLLVDVNGAVSFFSNGDKT